jgi:hypothetical protein
MFIPANNIEIGDRVKAKFHINTIKGMFTEGHEFTVTGYDDIGNRGWELTDDQGRRAIEVPTCMIEKIER